jgi:hypothetical protein
MHILSTYFLLLSYGKFTVSQEHLLAIPTLLKYFLKFVYSVSYCIGQHLWVEIVKKEAKYSITLTMHISRPIPQLDSGSMLDNFADQWSCKCHTEDQQHDWISRVQHLLHWTHSVHWICLDFKIFNVPVL